METVTPVVKDKKATVTVETEVSKNGTNTITVSNTDNVDSVQVKFDNASSLEAFKSGTGTLEIVTGISTVKLPFSVIGAEAMKDAKSVTLNVSISKDAKILGKLKNGVQKVFNFDLIVEKTDGTSVKIHKFANGQAEVSFKVTEEDLKGLDVNKLAVLYYNEETGKFEALETTIKDGVVTFKTSHFSSFVLGEKDVNTTSKTTKTSDSNGMLIFTVAALISLGAVSIVAIKKRKLQR